MTHKSKLARVLEYWTRQAGRGVFLVLAIAILFLVIMVFIWVVPRIWQWATG